MKKRIISIMAILALSFGPMSLQTLKAQIAIMDEEENTRLDVPESDLPAIPQLGLTIDQYAPLGGEILVLGCLGGAYLLGKRRKKHA